MALLAVLVTICALPVALFIWSAQTLARNVARAKASGIPYVVRWVSPINPFWLLYGSSIVRACQRLGIASKNLNTIYSFGWEANARAEIHLEYGDAFLVVHPAGMQLCVADAEAAYNILQRRTDFARNMEEMAVLNVYGKNLSTVDDYQWQRHRKMTGVTFTEKNNELVWQESLAQSEGMLNYWLRIQKDGPIRSIHEDTKIFTLNVLASALFNKSYAFEGKLDKKDDQHAIDPSYQYRDSLNTILGGIIHILVLGEEGLKKWWTSAFCKQTAAAMATFRSYILNLMEEERTHIVQGRTDRNHLVARLAKACEDPDEAETAEKESTMTSKKLTLTETEIISNLFVYAFAGNDTTAISLTTLLVHLSANPSTQDWLAEEINHYIPTGNPTTWSYANFSKLKRCNAVIMESIRLCHPLGQLVKTTGSTPQPLKVGDKTYTIPAETSVHISLPALHSHPRYWGSDPMAWNPKQFITTTNFKASSTTNTTQKPSSQFESEVLAPDTTPTFIPWAWGQRVCPGKRFSQVELTAVLAALLRDWRIEVVPEEGETNEEARKRAWREGLKIDHEGHMLHEIARPEGIGMRWVRREGKA